MDSDPRIKNLETDLDKITADYEEALKTISTGKPTYEQLASISVDAYGSKMDLSSVATFVFESATNVVVNLFDKNIRNDVVRSIENAKLGVSIQDNGTNLRLNFRALTDEDKKDRAKQLGDLTESFKVRMRLARQDVKSKLKADESLREDDEAALLDKVQKILDSYVQKVDAMSQKKKDLILN